MIRIRDNWVFTAPFFVLFFLQYDFLRGSTSTSMDLVQQELRDLRATQEAQQQALQQQQAQPQQQQGSSIQTQALDLAKQGASSVGSAILDKVKGPATSVGEKVLSKVVSAGSSLLGIGGVGTSATVGTGVTGGTVAAGTAAEGVAAAGTAAGTAGSSITGALSGIGSAISGAATTAGTTLSAAATTAAGAIGSAASTAAGAASTAAGAVGSAITGAVGSAGGGGAAGAGILGALTTAAGGLSATGVGAIVVVAVVVLAGLAIGISFIKWDQRIVFGDNLLRTVTLPGARVPTRYMVDIDYLGANEHIRFTVKFNRATANDKGKPVPFLGLAKDGTAKINDDRVKLDEKYPESVIKATRKVLCIKSVTITDFNDRTNFITIPVKSSQNQCAGHIFLVDIDPQTKKLIGHKMTKDDYKKLDELAKQHKDSNATLAIKPSANSATNHVAPATE